MISYMSAALAAVFAAGVAGGGAVTYMAVQPRPGRRRPPASSPSSPVHLVDADEPFVDVTGRTIYPGPVGYQNSAAAPLPSGCVTIDLSHAIPTTTRKPTQPAMPPTRPRRTYEHSGGYEAPDRPFRLPKVPSGPGQGAALADPSRVIRVHRDSVGNLWNEHPSGFVSKADDADGEWQHVTCHVVATAFGQLTEVKAGQGAAPRLLGCGCSVPDQTVMASAPAAAAVEQHVTRHITSGSSTVIESKLTSPLDVPHEVTLEGWCDTCRSAVHVPGTLIAIMGQGGTASGAATCHGCGGEVTVSTRF